MQRIARRQNDCSPCGAYCCKENEVCYKDTYYYVSMCSATATATVISASTETATATAIFTVTTEPTYSTSSTSTTTSSSSTASTSSSSPLTLQNSSTITASSSSLAPFPASQTTSTSSPASTPLPTPTTQPTGLSTGTQAAIGASTGAFGAAILALVIYLCCRRHRRHKSRPTRKPIPPGSQEGSELEDVPSGGGFAQIRERELTAEELDRRRREAEEERRPAKYSRSGPNPWAASASDVEGRREDDINDIPMGSPFSPEAVGNRQQFGHPRARGPHGSIPSFPPPPQYYRR